MQVFVGSTDVTSQFNAFFGRDGVSIDGNFQGGTETTAYTQALTYLRNQLRGAVPAEGVAGQSRAEVRAAISERFAAYTDLVQNGCESTHQSRPILQGMYEELTQFIESDAFQSASPAMQQKLVGLQSEVFSRLEQAGTHRGVEQPGEGTGTATELAQFNPIAQDFQAHPVVIENVIPAAGQISFDQQCQVDLGDATTGGSLNIYGSEGAQPQPFEGNIINTDFRYGLHQRPAAPEPEEAAPPPAESGGDDFDPLGGSDDPLDGLF